MPSFLGLKNAASAIIESSTEWKISWNPGQARHLGKPKESSTKNCWKSMLKRKVLILAFHPTFYTNVAVQ